MANSDTLSRLADRVLRGAVVPFLGAGFSYGARHPDGWTSQPQEMPERLKERLDGVLNAKACDGAPAACTLRQVRNNDGGSLARLAELGSLLLGPNDVCSTLRIDQYEDLMPLPAHRYLAYLAREGLIREIITTNYDCCLETAFKDCLGPDQDLSHSLAVITSLDGYRTMAGRHTRPGHLLIYKINGCAASYAKESKAENLHTRKQAAERIILTERQLQTFRRENWARDLLRDRARTRTLLFSGFGSEEPQIRHTVMDLVEEFQDGACLDRSDEVMDLPNAPFIQIHEPQLSFYQLQILIGFLDAHITPSRSIEQFEQRIEPVFRNVVSGKAGKRFDASAFLRKLFILVFLQLVRNQAQGGGYLSFWLQELTPSFRSWILEFLPSTGREPTGWRTLARMLAPRGRGSPFPLPLFSFLFAMVHPGSPDRRDYYCPLQDEALMIMITLIFIGQFRAPSSPSSPSELIANQKNGAKPLTVRLLAEYAVDSVYEDQQTECQGRLLRLIVIPSRVPRPVAGRWFARKPVDSRTLPVLRVGQWVAVSAADLIAKARTPDRLPEVIADCFAETRPRPAARMTRIDKAGAGT